MRASMARAISKQWRWGSAAHPQTLRPDPHIPSAYVILLLALDVGIDDRLAHKRNAQTLGPYVPMFGS